MADEVRRRSSPTTTCTSATKVCTLGINVAENLFGADVDPTGTELRIRNQIFHVLGVMEPKGASSSGQNQDDQILAPYTTVMKKLQGTEFLNYILVGARSADRSRGTSDALSTQLRITHKIAAGRRRRLPRADAGRHDRDAHVGDADDDVAARGHRRRVAAWSAASAS